MKDHQKLLRNLMVLEMVKSILDKFDPDSQHARYSDHIHVFLVSTVELFTIIIIIVVFIGQFAKPAMT